MSPNKKQSWILLGITLNHLGYGMVLAYPYSLLPALMAPGSTIKIDLETGSWLASSTSMTTVIGLIVGSWIMESLGRKLAHIIIVLPSILAWILIYFATNVTVLLIGRAVLGIGIASLYIGCTIVGEYMSPENRGIFLGAKSLSFCFGGALTHVLSNYFDWRSVALWSLAPIILVVSNTLTWPESPSWLAAKGRFKESEKYFFGLRGTNEKSIKEFEALILLQKEKVLNLSEKETFRKKIIEFFYKITRKDFIKPALVILVSFILLESSGRHTFPAYAQDIIGGINGNIKSQSFYITITVDVISIVSSFTSCLLCKYFGRRSLLFFSGISCLVLLGIICPYLYLVSIEKLSNDKTWLPLSLLVLYFTFSFLGCGTLPITLFAELFPLEHKGFAITCTGFLCSMSLFVFLKTTPIMLASLKVYGTFAVNGGVMAFSMLYLYLNLPETRNRTLQEIENFFNYGRFIDDVGNNIENHDERKEMLNP